MKLRPKVPAVSRRGLSVLTVVGVVAFVLSLVIVGNRISHVAAKTDTTASRVSHLTAITAQQSAILDAQAAGLKEANRRLRDAGKPQVSVPAIPPSIATQGATGLTGSTGLTGEQGPRGPMGLGLIGPRGAPGPAPSATEVAQAVAAYCSRGACAGHGPTAGQVAAAVSTYCNARGECVGPKGADGSTGAIGDRGPGPTDAQVEDAVSLYCSLHDGCQGPKGTQGDTGPQGPPGADGAQGPTGGPGAAAYPFSFTFTVPPSVPAGSPATYTCTVNDPATPVICTQT